MANYQRSYVTRRSWSYLTGKSLLVVLLCMALAGTITRAQPGQPDADDDPVTDVIDVTELSTGVTDSVTDVIDVTELSTKVTDSVTDVIDVTDIFTVSFTLVNFSSTDISREVEKQIVKELESWLPYTEVEFTQFKKENKLPRVNVTVHVPEGSSSADELLLFLNKVEDGGTIAGYSLQNVDVAYQGGRRMPLTFCATEHANGCPEGMNCTDSLKDDQCGAKCAPNPTYCMNGGTCSEIVSSFIECSCPERYEGERCQNDTRFLSDTVRYILIGAACLFAFLLLLILLCCLLRKCRTQRRKSTRGLYGVENVVALHSLHEEDGGVAIQTDDSFLVNLSNENGVPPKPGCTHKIMQTNDSFLLARSQTPRTKIGQVGGHPKNPNNTSPPSASQAANGARPDPSSTGVNNNQPRTPPKLNDAETGAVSEGTPPRLIVKV